MERDCSTSPLSLRTSTYFNSHAHVERDYSASVNNSTHLNFNSHAHVERDTNVPYRLSVTPYFNSHAHVERDFFADKTTLKGVNFNSHAHVERDENTFINIAHCIISTHTLTWSVTVCICGWNISVSFQLTRSRGA